MEGNLRFKTNWASLIVGSEFTVLLCFTLYLKAIFQGQAPGGLYLERLFNGGFFALPVWVACIWRGLYIEGLIFGFYGRITTGVLARILVRITTGILASTSST